jgi:hypothetical protein
MEKIKRYPASLEDYLNILRQYYASKTDIREFADIFLKSATYRLKKGWIKVDYCSFKEGIIEFWKWPLLNGSIKIITVADNETELERKFSALESLLGENNK